MALSFSHHSDGRWVFVAPTGTVIACLGSWYLSIEKAAVMRREFGTVEPPPSEVDLGQGNGATLLGRRVRKRFAGYGRGTLA